MFRTAVFNNANKVCLSAGILDERKANNQMIPFLFRCQGSLSLTLRRGDVCGLPSAALGAAPAVQRLVGREAGKSP